MIDRMMTAKEAAAYLGVTIDTLRAWSRKGLVPAYKMGPRLWRYLKADLDKCSRSREV